MYLSHYGVPLSDDLTTFEILFRAKICHNFRCFFEKFKTKEAQALMTWIHRLMPCPFTGPKMFCASPNFLSQPKNLTAFSASTKTGTKNNFTNALSFYRSQNFLCQTKNLFTYCGSHKHFLPFSCTHLTLWRRAR